METQMEMWSTNSPSVLWVKVQILSLESDEFGDSFIKANFGFRKGIKCHNWTLETLETNRMMDGEVDQKLPCYCFDTYDNNLSPLGTKMRLLFEKGAEFKVGFTAAG